MDETVTSEIADMLCLLLEGMTLLSALPLPIHTLRLHVLPFEFALLQQTLNNWDSLQRVETPVYTIDGMLASLSFDIRSEPLFLTMQDEEFAAIIKDMVNCFLSRMAVRELTITGCIILAKFNPILLHITLPQLVKLEKNNYCTKHHT